MSTNSECSNLCCPNYNVVGAGAPNVSGNNMAPQYRVTAGQYEILTHRVDPVRAGFMDRTPVQLSPGEMGSCGYNSIVSAYGRNANCCSTPYKPMGCCPGTWIFVLGLLSQPEQTSETDQPTNVNLANRPIQHDFLFH